jgi:hypothetical protein
MAHVQVLQCWHSAMVLPGKRGRTGVAANMCKMKSGGTTRSWAESRITRIIKQGDMWKRPSLDGDGGISDDGSESGRVHDGEAKLAKRRHMPMPWACRHDRRDCKQAGFVVDSWPQTCGAEAEGRLFVQMLSGWPSSWLLDARVRVRVEFVRGATG